MPHAQLVRSPFTKGVRRLRHMAAVARRAKCRYSSFRYSLQNASVSTTTASYTGCICFGTFSDLPIIAIKLASSYSDIVFVIMSLICLLQNSVLHVAYKHELLT